MLLTRRVKFILGSAVLAALASAPGEVAAATLEITATVPDACSVDSGTVAFGEYVAGQGSTLVSMGNTFNVECSSPAEVTIGLDHGLQPQNVQSTRAMASSTTDDFLEYELYTPGGLQAWNSVPGVSFSLIQGSNPIEVEGRIPAGQIVGGGDYSDTVQITLTFQ